MQRPPPHQADDFALKETAPHLGGGGAGAGDKLTSTYDLLEQMQYLYVRVVKAKDLPPKDVTGNLDPYAEVRLGNYKGTTRHFEKRSNPEWNQVFAFSKDRIQSSSVEVVVKDKDFVNDDFVGRVAFDLNEVPKRVPPDSPLAPQWYRLEDRKEDKVRGEIMIAVWMGTQADEACNTDAATIPGDGINSIRSKVYLTPKHLFQEAKQRIPPVLAELDDPMEEDEAVASASGMKGCAYCGGLGHRIKDCPKLEHQKTVAISTSRKDYFGSGGYRAEI